MRKITLYTLLLLLMVMICQCSKDSIDKKIYGAITNGSFYKTVTDIQGALAGAYFSLKVAPNNEFGLNHMLIGDNTTDDAIDESSLGIYTTSASDGTCSIRYTVLYKCIAQANAIIARAPSATGDKTLITRYINEAKLLRAYCYYSLATVFGGVPLVLKPITPLEAVNTPRATADEIFAQAIIDLNDATALPGKKQYAAADQFRVTSGLAYALMGKIYMFQGNFIKAEEVLKTVVQSGDYALLADYGANWRMEGAASTEAVFEIPNKITTDITLQGPGSNIPRAFGTGGSNMDGFGGHPPSKDLYNEFEANDPRIPYTFLMTGDRFQGDIVDVNNSGNARSGYYGRKTTVPAYLRPNTNFYTIDYTVRMIRYADILLLYAEALNENGKPTEALSYINQVRARARQTAPMDPQRIKQAYLPIVTAATLPPITLTDKALLRTAIWHERRCELGMEGWRREDLVRQKRFAEVMLAYPLRAGFTTQKGPNFKAERDYLLPIPLTEIQYSGGLITQNPGY